MNTVSPSGLSARPVAPGRFVSFVTTLPDRSVTATAWSALLLTNTCPSVGSTAMSENDVSGKETLRCGGSAIAGRAVAATRAAAIAVALSHRFHLRILLPSVRGRTPAVGKLARGSDNSDRLPSQW